MSHANTSNPERAGAKDVALTATQASPSASAAITFVTRAKHVLDARRGTSSRSSELKPTITASDAKAVANARYVVRATCKRTNKVIALFNWGVDFNSVVINKQFKRLESTILWGDSLISRDTTIAVIVRVVNALASHLAHQVMRPDSQPTRCDSWERAKHAQIVGQHRRNTRDFLVEERVEIFPLRNGRLRRFVNRAN